MTPLAGNGVEDEEFKCLARLGGVAVLEDELERAAKRQGSEEERAKVVEFLTKESTARDADPSQVRLACRVVQACCEYIESGKHLEDER